MQYCAASVKYAEINSDEARWEEIKANLPGLTWLFKYLKHWKENIAHISTRGYPPKKTTRKNLNNVTSLFHMHDAQLLFWLNITSILIARRSFFQNDPNLVSKILRAIVNVEPKFWLYNDKYHMDSFKNK